MYDLTLTLRYEIHKTTSNIQHTNGELCEVRSINNFEVSTTWQTLFHSFQNWFNLLKIFTSHSIEIALQSVVPHMHSHGRFIDVKYEYVKCSSIAKLIKWKIRWIGHWRWLYWQRFRSSKEEWINVDELFECLSQYSTFNK